MAPRMLRDVARPDRQMLPRGDARHPRRGRRPDFPPSRGRDRTVGGGDVAIPSAIQHAIDMTATCRARALRSAQEHGGLPAVATPHETHDFRPPHPDSSAYAATHSTLVP